MRFVLWGWIMNVPSGNRCYTVNKVINNGTITKLEVKFCDHYKSSRNRNMEWVYTCDKFNEEIYDQCKCQKCNNDGE